MKVEFDNWIEIRNEINSLIDAIKNLFDVRKENIVKNIKIYSDSNELFDSEKYLNKKKKTIHRWIVNKKK